MTTLAACILHFSLLHDINPAVTTAIIKLESNFNPVAVGLVGEVGLMQIRPEYVPETKEELFDPCINVKRGTFLLSQAKKYCKHTVDRTWVNCYNLGMTGGSKLKHPKLFPYYKKFTEILTTVSTK